MTTTTDTIKSTYPLQAYQYQVSFPDASGKAMTTSFASVSGMSIRLGHATYYQSPGDGQTSVEVMTVPTRQDTSNPITFTRGVVNADSTSILYLYSWISSIKANVVDKRDITVNLCDETGTPVISWKIVNAFPIRLDAPTFNANSNEAAIECLQVVADNIVMSAV